MDKDNLEMLLVDIRGKCDLVLEGHFLPPTDGIQRRIHQCTRSKKTDYAHP